MSARVPTSADRVAALTEHENARFVTERPRSAELLERGRRSMPRGVPMAWMESLYEHAPTFVDSGRGARFRDVEGHEYLDLYIGDMSGFCGHAPPPVVQAVTDRMSRGNHFLLAGEDAIVVSEYRAGCQVPAVSSPSTTSQHSPQRSSRVTSRS